MPKPSLSPEGEARADLQLDLTYQGGEEGTGMHLPQRRTSQGQQAQGTKAMESSDAGAGWREG